MSLRVVYLDHVARLSGAEIALTRVLPALAEQVDVRVILGEDGPLVDGLGNLGIRVEVLPMDPAARDLRKDRVRPTALPSAAVAASAQYVWRLARRLRELRPDLLHTHSLKAAFYGGVAGRLIGVPVVWHIHDRLAPDYLPPAAVRLVQLGARILPSAVVTNSYATLRTLPRVRRAAVVPNALLFGKGHESAEATDAPWRPFRLATIGRLAPWKGQELFLDAFAETFPNDEELPDRVAEAWVVGSALFGEDDYAASLHMRARQLGIEDRVHFRGFQADVSRELAQVDLLVHCSTTPEPFGNVVLEGMAAGVAVIAADAGGPAEIITSGTDGVLTPLGDRTALGRAMRRLRDDEPLRRRLAAAGRATASQYTPERTAAGLLAVYEQVTRRHGRAWDRLTPVESIHRRSQGSGDGVGVGQQG